MKIGIIAAMDLELQPFLHFFTPKKSVELAKNQFFISHFQEMQLIMVCSGQGKTNSAIYTQLLLQHFEIDLLINVGICGGISPNLDVLDVLIGEKYVHYDIRKKQSLFKFPNQLYYLGDPYSINKFKTLNTQLKKGVFGTGEGFVADKQVKEQLILDFHIDCVDMESASIAQTCYLNEVNFISLRVVSDTADEQSTHVPENFQLNAMNRVFNLVYSFITNIT